MRARWHWTSVLSAIARLAMVAGAMNSHTTTRGKALFMTERTGLVAQAGGAVQFSIQESWVLTGCRLISNSSGAAGRSGHSGQDFSAGGRLGGGGGGIYNAGALKLAKLHV